MSMSSTRIDVNMDMTPIIQPPIFRYHFKGPINGSVDFVFTSVVIPKYSPTALERSNIHNSFHVGSFKTSTPQLEPRLLASGVVITSGGRLASGEVMIRGR